MNKLSKKMHILAGMYLFAVFFMACPNNAQSGRQEPNAQGKTDILIKYVTLDGGICHEGKEAFVTKDRAELIVELQKTYEELSVKVGSLPIIVVTSGKKVKCNLQGITDAGILVNIEITAKNKNTKIFNFIAKLGGELVIESVRLSGKRCFENETVETASTTSDLSVTFKEIYDGLSVKVNEHDAKIQGKVATAKIENITETGIDINIVAIAKDKALKIFKFRAILKLGEISVESVTFLGKPSFKDSVIDTKETEGDVVITFEEIYDGLNVKINNENASLSGKMATKRISNIREKGTEVKIEASANGKASFSYKFILKKLKVGEIGIESVSFEGVPCPEKKTIEIEKTEGEIKVTFVESYTDLQVTINGSPAAVSENVATLNISNINKTDVTINATATGKIPREYKFQINKLLPIAMIKELTIKAKDISNGKDEKTYSETTAPLLTEIKVDGSTKVGNAKEPKAIIKIKYSGTPEEQKLKVENVSANTSKETTSSNWGSMETESIELKKGDNSIVITYSEKGKKDLVYKLIVGYAEPEYEPINLISIEEREYNTKDELEKLIQGAENFTIDGEPTVKVEVEMPELWYNDEGWNIKVDGVACPKTEFKKVGYSDIIYRLTKNVSLTKGGIKLIKIEFENITRTYKKEYKANVTHKLINKLKNLVFINPTINKEISKRTYTSYRFDGAMYNGATEFIAEDRMEKALFVVEAEDEEIEVKYAISETKIALDQISSWTNLTKEGVSYTDYNYSSITVNAYPIKNMILKHGSNFLYISLEKNGKKTHYLQEINREKLPLDNTDRDYIKTIYQDVNGDVVEDRSPISAKGLIRVLTKNPRAKVELVTPQTQNFIKANDGWYECQIGLNTVKTVFSYNIIAENGNKKLYEDEYLQAFIKSEAITEVKFGYKKGDNSWERELTLETEGKRYINIDEKKVKNKKLYLFVSAFKDVLLTNADFIKISEESPYGTSTDYVFEVDVTSILDTPNTNKEYTLSLTLKGKPCGELKLVLLLKDEIINSIGVCREVAIFLPNGHYVCKADLSNTYYYELTVRLNFIDNEKQNPNATNRAIKVFKNGIEIPMTVNQYETQKLEFKNQGFKVGENEKFTLKVQYFVDKTQTTSPTKEYILEIEDI